MERIPDPERVSRRLKDQFAPAYLTLTSIIQGVALSFLAARVETTYIRFEAADWLLTIVTFVIYLIIWQEYVMQVLAFVWVPTLLDTLVPFAFLVCELFLAHFVFHDLHSWLLIFGLTCIVGAIAQGVTIAQARTYVEENRDVIRTLAFHGWLRAAFVAVCIIVSLGLWSLYAVLYLEQVRLVIAVIVLVVAGAFVVNTIPYWNRLLVYAMGERKVQQRHKIL